ncbi:hypothetical protein KC19_5G092300 [Ceratodon purpureus]|uniref:Uncharacterized protein n=1 Tax=Ceratodon purpureus TaxID=3225 RepID=A0A8T0HZH5_CERPU|nr:hypothetical protein KC19_5G092300 [Ceratodon purpureus]
MLVVIITIIIVSSCTPDCKLKIGSSGAMKQSMRLRFHAYDVSK